MSIRAYKIINIETAPAPTFNASHEDEIMHLADIRHYDDGGYITFDRDIVEEEIERLTNLEDTNPRDKDTIALLFAILNDMGDDTMVEYLSF